jgi:Tripartite tricarboxylate transporter TctB family
VKIADQKNFLTGLLYLVIGGAVTVASTRYEIGTADRMGPGYFPLLIGFALALTGMCVLGAAVRQHSVRSQIGSWPLRTLSIVLVAVVLFGLSLEPMGLLVAVPVLVAVSSLAHKEFSWRSLALSLLVLMPLTWGVFIVLLGLQFPLLPFFLRP